MKALIKIGDYEFPEPSSYDATSSTFVSSARNSDGYCIGSVIRDDVAKVELSWKFLTVQDWSNILQCFDPKFGGNFYNNVEFFNQTTGTWETRKFYVSDRKAGMFRRNPSTGEIMGYLSPKLSLVEV